MNEDLSFSVERFQGSSNLHSIKSRNERRSLSESDGHMSSQELYEERWPSDMNRTFYGVGIGHGP